MTDLENQGVGSRVEAALARRFDDVEELDVADRIFRHGSPLDALMYGQLLWPDFVMLEDIVFWPKHFEADRARIQALIDHYGGDLEQAEKSINFIEVPELFANYPDYVDEFLDELTRLLQETWTARLHSLFPGRQFTVEFVPENDATGETVGLWFHQIRSS